MSFISNLFNGSMGNGFQAGAANVLNPSTVGQANTAYDQTQQGLANQQAFVNASAAQNGLGNQSSVFNQLQGVANGTGPNPAQAMLNQATGANVANQAALMASQRGAGANPGLIARQAAMQGGALQQQAAGQGATLQANQSLGALGQLSGIAGQQVAQQQGALNSYNNAAQGQQQNILNGIQGQNNANVSMQSNQNTVNGGIAQQNAANQDKGIGGLLNGLGGVASLIPGVGAIAHAAHFAHGGNVSPGEPMSHIGRHMKGLPPHGGTPIQAMLSPGEIYLPPQKAQAVANGANPMAMGGKVPGKAEVKGDSRKNDTVQATVETGGVVIPRSILEGKNPAAAAAKFVQEHLKNRKTK